MLMGYFVWYAGLMGASRTSAYLAHPGSEQSDQEKTTPEFELEKEYIPNKPLLFNCTFSMEKLAMPLALPSHTDQETDQGRRIIGESLYDFLVQSIVRTYGTFSTGEGSPKSVAGEGSFHETEIYRDNSEPLNFHFGVSRTNQTEAEIWLAAYVGRFFVNQLSLLNTLLLAIEIEGDSSVVQSKLAVKWVRIAIVLGALIGFQVVFAALALWYCQGKFEFVEDLPTMSSVLGGIPEGGIPEGGSAQGGLDFAGWFVQEDDGYRWVLFKHE